MKGQIIDVFFLVFPVLFLAILLLFSPFSIDIKRKQVYQNKLGTLASQDILSAIVSSTNPDSLNDNRPKINYEIIGEKALMPQQDVKFLKTDLEKILENKCYKFELMDIRVTGLICPIDKGTGDGFSRPFVIPFNPNKLTSIVTFVMK